LTGVPKKLRILLSDVRSPSAASAWPGSREIARLTGRRWSLTASSAISWGGLLGWFSGGPFGHQHCRTGRAPSLEIAVRVGRTGERISLPDDHAHFLRPHRGEQLARRGFELGARGDVVEERRAGEEQ